jgi:hypothetical protein
MTRSSALLLEVGLIVHRIPLEDQIRTDKSVRTQNPECLGYLIVAHSISPRARAFCHILSERATKEGVRERLIGQ